MALKPSFLFNFYALIMHGVLVSTIIQASAAQGAGQNQKPSNALVKDTEEITIKVYSGSDNYFDVKTSKAGTVRNLRNAFASKVKSDDPSSFTLFYIGLKPFETRGSGIGRSIGEIDLNKDALLADVLKIKGIKIFAK